ncbi:MAG: hypothetical protein ACYDAA_13695 [Syntrophales bacterium]
MNLSQGNKNVVVGLSVLSQLYLFFRARRIIHSSRWPERFKSRAVRAVGIFLAVFFTANMVILTPYPEGLYRIGASRLYVSRGIGTTFTPVRLNAPPEITLVHLTGKPADADGHT